jgi:hypothetical protein
MGLESIFLGSLMQISKVCNLTKVYSFSFSRVVKATL